MMSFLSTISLLPYLNSPKNPFYIQLYRLNKLNSFHYPFSVLDDSAPFTKLLEAELRINTKNRLKSLFLLIQKDYYFFNTTTLKPFTNLDIEKCWQNAFKRYIGNRRGDFTLKEQVAPDGKLIPFRSLFFCQYQELFFHPVCPICSNELSLCSDDLLLAQYALELYSKTLKRYLYCPKCHAEEAVDIFYVDLKEVYHSQNVKDRRDLILSFRDIRIANEKSQTIPCIECDQYAQCYSDAEKAVDRIIPFSFYPFHMLVYEDATLPAREFIKIISGADLKEIKESLQEKNSSLLSFMDNFSRKNDQKRFLFTENTNNSLLESLFLKLTFLEEYFRLFFNLPTPFQFPIDGLSLDHVWIKIAHQNNTLPYLWNFSLEIFDVVPNDLQPQLPRNVIIYHDLYYLGVVWFYVLVGNKKNTISDIVASIGRMIQEWIQYQDHGNDIMGSFYDRYDEVFGFQNISWNYSDVHLDNKAKDIWRHVLTLGWTLLRANFFESFKFSKKDFLYELLKLKNQVKNIFITSQNQVKKNNRSYKDNDTVIRKIILELLSDWKMNSEDEIDNQTEDEEQSGQEEPLKETIIVRTLSNKMPEEDGIGINDPSDCDKGQTDQEKPLKQTIVVRMPSNGMPEENNIEINTPSDWNNFRTDQEKPLKPTIAVRIPESEISEGDHPDMDSPSDSEEQDEQDKPLKETVVIQKSKNESY